MNDTPLMTRDWCPQCDPTTDPFRELVVERWCYRHAPTAVGTADDQVPEREVFHGTAYDVEGEENRARCELIHRGRA